MSPLLPRGIDPPSRSNSDRDPRWRFVSRHLLCVVGSASFCYDGIRVRGVALTHSGRDVAVLLASSLHSLLLTPNLTPFVQHLSRVQEFSFFQCFRETLWRCLVLLLLVPEVRLETFEIGGGVLVSSISRPRWGFPDF